MRKRFVGGSFCVDEIDTCLYISYARMPDYSNEELGLRLFRRVTPVERLIDEH